MDARTLCEALAKLQPAARRELSLAARAELSLLFKFMARGVEVRLAMDGLTPDDRRSLEHQYQTYAAIAVGLVEEQPEKVIERIEASAELARVGSYQASRRQDETLHK